MHGLLNAKFVFRPVHHTGRTEIWVLCLVHFVQYASLNDGDTFWTVRRCANVIEWTYTNLDSTV